jgi:hypothetical protein
VSGLPSVLVFVVAAAVLLDAAWRTAAALGATGALRIVAAAPLAAGTAELEILLLGSLDQSGSQPLLLALSVAVWIAARVALPAPWLVRREGARWTSAELLGLGAALGLAAVWAAWIQKHPGLATDPLTYHLPEAIAWAQHGDGGSVRQVVYEFPVGNYPLADETLVSWLLATSRSFAPALLWAPAMAALTAVAGMTGLRQAGVAVLPAALAVASILAIPIWSALFIGPHTDVGALAWLTCTGTLTIAARERRALLVPALVAGGLALGTKTTTAPMLLALALVVLRPPLPRRGPLLAALAAGGVIGGLWYVRNLVLHGSPLWPFLATPWSDDIPPILRGIDVSFLDRLSESLDGRTDLYFKILGAAPLLLVAAAAAAIVTRERRVVIAAVIALLGALIWARTPYTGRPDDPVRDLSLTTVRYLVPSLTAAATAVALASARHRIWTAVLGAIAAVSVVKALNLGAPDLPSGWTLLTGAALGAATAHGLSRCAVPRFRAEPVAAVALLVAALALTAAGDGFVRRHATNLRLSTWPMMAFASQNADFTDQDFPILSAPQVFGALAGDRLQHDIGLLPRTVSCAEVRSTPGWVVIGTPPYSSFRAEFTAADCLKDLTPIYADPEHRIYDLRQTAITSSTSERSPSTSVKSFSVIEAARGSGVFLARLSSTS